MFSTQCKVRFSGARAALGAGLLAALAAACSAPVADRGFVASSPPAAMILRALAGERWPVTSLLAPGQSPHTYAPRPSDAARAEASLGLFYVSEDLDGWAATLPAATKVALFELLPDAFRRQAADDHGHDHGDWDPHFWGDPLAVRAMLGPLTEVLVSADPEGAAEYRAAAERFASELAALDEELRAMLRPVEGTSVILFHPSWGYFLARYGIRVAGVVEPFAGKEATPRFLSGLAELAKREGARAIFTEPQLARRPAEVVAEAAGLPCRELDPLGGAPGRETYADLLRYNARVLLEALQ